MDRKFEPPPDTNTARLFFLIPESKSFSYLSSLFFTFSAKFTHSSLLEDRKLCGTDNLWARKEADRWEWDWAKDKDGNFLGFCINGIVEPERKLLASIERSGDGKISDKQRRLLWLGVGKK